MKKILVPCDFSLPAQQAFRFAMDIASASGGKVMVLNVIDLPFLYETTFGVQPYWNSPVFLVELAEEAKKNYEKMIGTYAEPPAPVSFNLERGPVTPTILRIIEDKEIDLVVMGTEGASGERKFLIGSNTEKIVRLSTVPVCSIRKAPVISSIQNIVFPSTMDLNQDDLVDHVKALQQFFNATIHIVLINTPSKFLRNKEADDALKEFARHYAFNNYTLNFRNDTHEQEGIINFAEEIKADLIAMGTHSRKGLAHLLLGSITEDVVEHTGCPIWTFPLTKKSKQADIEKVADRKLEFTS